MTLYPVRTRRRGRVTAALVLLLGAAPVSAQRAALDAHVGVVAPPGDYAAGFTGALSLRLPLPLPLQLRVARAEVGVRRSSDYGRVVPDARRTLTAALVLLQSRANVAPEGPFARGFAAAGYGRVRERGTSILGAAAVDRSDHGFTTGAGLKLGYALRARWQLELESGLLAVFADPYGTSDGPSWFVPVHGGVTFVFGR